MEKYYLIHIKITDNFRVIHIFDQDYYTLKAISLTYSLIYYTKFFISDWELSFSTWGSIYYFQPNPNWIFDQFYCIYIPLMPLWPMQFSPSILDCIYTLHRIKSVLLPLFPVQILFFKESILIVVITTDSLHISGILLSWWCIHKPFLRVDPAYSTWLLKTKMNLFYIQKSVQNYFILPNSQNMSKKFI